MPITATAPFSQLSRSMRRQDSVSTDTISGLELAYLRDSVDGFDNSRSAVDDYNETMQESKSFFVLPDYQKPSPSTAGTSINASYSASSLGPGPDPYAYTPPNPVTGEGTNKTFINPDPVGKEAFSSTFKSDNKTASSENDKSARQSSDSRIPLDSSKKASTEEKSR